MIGLKMTFKHFEAAAAVEAHDVVGKTNFFAATVGWGFFGSTAARPTGLVARKQRDAQVAHSRNHK
jgi:hypothetical protein